jgi:hypothetical protein
VPKIMQAMLDLVLPKLEGGVKIHARAATIYAPEGDVAVGLAKIQENFPGLEIGSYPFFRPSGPGSTIVVRGTDPQAIDQAIEALYALAEGLGATIKDVDAG